MKLFVPRTLAIEHPRIGQKLGEEPAAIPDVFRSGYVVDVDRVHEPAFWRLTAKAFGLETVDG